MTTITELLHQWQESIEALHTQTQTPTTTDPLYLVEGFTLRSRLSAGEDGQNVAGVNRCVWGTIDLT